MLITVATLALGVIKVLKTKLRKRNEFLGFLSRFNRWNWYPNDKPINHPDYTQWKEQIEKLYEVRGSVPRDMKSEYNEMCTLYSKSKLDQEERNRIIKLTNELREEANWRFEK